MTSLSVEDGVGGGGLHGVLSPLSESVSELDDVFKLKFNVPIIFFKLLETSVTLTYLSYLHL